MGKVADGMAAIIARGHREQQNRGNRKKAVAIEASHGAKIYAQRQQTLKIRMQEVKVPAFAKVNLRLDVLGKRPDGFHELRTIFQTISLFDEVRLRKSSKPGISLVVQGNQLLAQEAVKKNLVYRAVDALRRELR